MTTNYITGPPLAHSLMALRRDGKLYIVHSIMKGLKVMEYKEYLDYAISENNTIMWFKLSEKNRKKFNETAAWEWVDKYREWPYGLRAFLPAPIDLAHGTFPQYLSNEVFILVGSILNMFMPNLTNLVLGDFINARLHVMNLTLNETSLLASEMNMKLEDIMAMPELDDYQYPNGEQWICSSIIIKIYQVAGVLIDKLNSKEFTPKDIFQMNIFDRDFKNTRPQVCKDADPNLEYCVIHGKYRIPAANFSRIDVYPYMNERCAMVPPQYLREDGC